MKRYAIANCLKELEKVRVFHKTLDEAFEKSSGKDVMEIWLHPEVWDVYINSPHKLGTNIHESDIKTVLKITEIGKKVEYSIVK